MTNAVHAVLTSLMSALVLAGADAAAQTTVYRCGPDGRTYSQAPCPAGRELDVSDPRSEAQQREAREAAAVEARLAQDLRAERREREREAAARGTGLAGIRKAPAPEAASPARPTGKPKPYKKKTGSKKPALASSRGSTSTWRP